jgi:hypothetical protein
MRLNKTDRRMIAENILLNIKKGKEEKVFNSKKYQNDKEKFLSVVSELYEKYCRVYESLEELKKELKDKTGISYSYISNDFVSRALREFSRNYAELKLPNLEEIEFELFKEENGARNVDDLIQSISKKFN